MQFRNLLTLVFLVFCISLHAQNIPNLPTARLIKTAATLFDAQQYDAAEAYYKKALQNGKAANNSYHQAQAHEGLAKVYSRTKQQTEAITAYQQAIKLYRLLNMKVIADVLSTQMRNELGIGDLYAGVEIGAKGIKLSVIELKATNGENDYALKLDTAINTDAAALSYQSEKETHDAIAILYGIIKDRFEIPGDRVHMVISSGLKQELDRYNKVDHFAGIVRPSHLDPKIRIRYVTPEEEAQLNFKGVVPQMNRLTANQLDVGSGNTKGGYLNGTRSFVPVTLPLGTKSFQRLVESRATGNLSIQEYQQLAERIIIDSLARTVIYYFRDKSEFKSRDVVYLSGGIVWSIASLMYPEQIRQNHVELTLQDIHEFRKKVFTDYHGLTNPELENRVNDKDMSATKDNIRRVVGTYDQKALLAGVIWLEELLHQINTANPNKKFIFPRYAYVGWISGYIIDKISKQYTDMAVK